MDHATVRLLLLSAGWKEKDIAQALAEGLDLPVPEPVHSGGAREVFLYLLQFTLLYIVVVALILLFFEYLNRLFPDPAQKEWAGADSLSLATIRWSLATVMVSSPFFLGLSRFLLREIRLKPEQTRSTIRRWLTCLTLFVAAVTALFDLITLVFYFLEGELSIRFVLKVIVLFVILGTVFVYYLLSLRAPRGETP